MKLKSKKLIISAGSTLALATTGLTAISCGSTVKRFDANQDNKIVVGIGWAKDGIQAQALNELFRVYNETEKDNADFVPVEIISLGNSYNDATSKVVTYLSSKDPVQLPNMLIAYPTALASVAGYNMQLHLDDNKDLSSSESLNDEYAINRSLFEEDFMAFNDRIAGIKKGKIYAIPFGKSSIISAMNTSLMSYVFESMISSGATVEPASKEFFDGIITKGKGDREAVKKLWGEVDKEGAAEIKGFVLKRSIFDNSSELIDFAKKAQQLFTNSRNKPKGNLHIFGIDDIAGFLSINVFAMTAQEKNDFREYYVKIKENGFIDYTAYRKTDSKAYKAFDEIAKKLYDAAKTGAIFMGGGGQYSSTYQTQHQIGFSMGSTAGYSFNFKPDKSLVNYVVNKEGGDFEVNQSLKNELEASTDPNLAGTLNKKFKNKIYKSTATATLTKYDIKLADAATDAKFAELMKSVTAGSNLLVNNPTFDKEYEAKKADFEKDGITLVGTDSKGGKIYFVKDLSKLNATTAIKKVELGTQNTLQENELEVLNAPRKWEESNKLKTVYVQGPSLITIHANEKEDKGTRKFVKWLTSNNKFKFKSGVTRDKKDEYFTATGKTSNEAEALALTPFEFIFKKASYVVPYKGAFDNPTKANPKNLFLDKAIEEFGKAIKTEGWSLDEEPADGLSDNFRNILVTAWKSPLTKIQNGVTGDVSYAKDIVKSLRDQSGTFGDNE